MKHRTWLKRLTWLPGLVTLGFLIAFVLTHREEGRTFVTLMKNVRLPWILLASLLQAFTYVSSATVWWLTLRRLGARLPLLALTRLSMEKLLVDQIVPTAGIGGTLLITRVLVKKNVPSGIATAGVFANLFSYYGAYAIAVLTSLAILWLDGNLNPIVEKISLFFFSVTLAIVLLAIALISRPHHPALRRIERWPSVKKALEALKKVPSKFLRNPRVYLPNIFFQMGVFILDAASLQVLLGALGHPADPFLTFASFMMASVVANLGPIPGGLGLFETSSVAMLVLAKIPLSTALAATLLMSALNFWLPMIPGLFFIQRDLKFVRRKNESTQKIS